MQSVITIDLNKKTLIDNNLWGSSKELKLSEVRFVAYFTNSRGEKISVGPYCKISGGFNSEVFDLPIVDSFPDKTYVINVTGFYIVPYNKVYFTTDVKGVVLEGTEQGEGISIPFFTSYSSIKNKLQKNIEWRFSEEGDIKPILKPLPEDLKEEIDLKHSAWLERVSSCLTEYGMVEVKRS